MAFRGVMVYISNYLCLFLTVSKPRHYRDPQGKEINLFTRSTNFLLAQKSLCVQVVAGPWSYIQPYRPSGSWRPFLSAVPSDVAALEKCLHRVYLSCAVPVSPCEQIYTHRSQTFRTCCFSLFSSLFWVTLQLLTAQNIADDLFLKDKDHD